MLQLHVAAHVEAKRPPFSLISRRCPCSVSPRCNNRRHHRRFGQLQKRNFWCCSTLGDEFNPPRRQLAHRVIAALAIPCQPFAAWAASRAPKVAFAVGISRYDNSQGVPLRCLAHVTAVQMKLPQPIVALPHPSFEWLPGRVRSSEISTGAFLLLLLALHRSKAGFFGLFSCCSMAFQFFPPSHTWDARRQ